MKVYIKRIKSQIDAVGEYDLTSNQLTVLKGSIVSIGVRHSEKFNGGKIIEKMRMENTKNRIVIKDITFKSPSSASNFVTGQSSNGWIEWKDEKGRKLKDAVKELEQ